METQIVTENDTGPIGTLISQLGLQAQGEEMFIGRVRGFPAGLKFIGSHDSLLMLCQIRYPVDAETKKISNIGYGAETSSLIEEKKIEVSVENKIAWLTIPDAAPLIESNSVPRILDSILAGFEQAGLAVGQDKCHYCQVQPVATLVCESGKVAQICPACLIGKAEGQSEDLSPSLSGGGISKVLTLGSLASAVGATGWALIWAGYDYLLERMGPGPVLVPRYLILIGAVCAGFLVGGPVGFILKKIPKRGDLFAGWMAVAFASASVVIGEILYVAWMIFKEYKVISFSAAAKILPELLADSGELEEIVVFAVASVVVAYQMARPKKKALKL